MDWHSVLRVAAPNSIVLVRDPTIGRTPDPYAGEPVAATESCLVVGTLGEVDGETEIHVGTAASFPNVDGDLSLVWSGVLQTDGRVTVETVHGDVLAERLVGPSAHIALWTNHATEPDLIWIVVDEPEDEEDDEIGELTDEQVESFLRVRRARSRAEYKALEHTQVEDQWADVRDLLLSDLPESRAAFRKVYDASGHPDEQIGLLDHYLENLGYPGADADFDTWLSGEAEANPEIAEVLEFTQRSIELEEQSREKRGDPRRKQERRWRRKEKRKQEGAKKNRQQ